MCGIFGAVGLELGEADGLRALRTLGHRGPDGEGSARLPGGAGFLGHTRLAIIDPSPDGAQPMANEDGTLSLTFNGEIYNHEALREELVRAGHSFRSRCDAEVVLHLYEEHGRDLVHRLRGMFAFGLYDANRRTLLLARDRLGVKPLVYHEDRGRICFASELKAIRAVPGLDLEPDPTAYYDFLTYEYVPAPKTVFTKVRKLPAGHDLLWSADGADLRRYWEPPAGPERAGSEDELLGDLEGLLEDAVRDHLVSDVPVGSFLSAGVDSTLVTSVAGEVAGKPLAAFTIGFEGRRNDEADEAAAIAARMGAPHEVRRFGEAELLADLRELPDLFDEPFADASALPMIELSRLASSRVKVVLSGDGGDETHGGYARYWKRAAKQAAYATARAVPGARLLAGMPPLASLPWARAVREDAIGLPASFHMGIPRAAKRMLLDFGDRRFDDYDDYWAVRAFEPELGTVRGQQRMDLATHLPEALLAKVDRTSMRFGLEVRPPLLDHRLVELGLSLPDACKARGDERKVLLRRLLARRQPAEVAGARKRGFSVPMKRFVRDGVIGPDGDVDVLGCFRVSHRKLRRTFRRSRDPQVWWILHALQEFLRSQG